MIRIQEISARETFEVRHPVLRKDKPLDTCYFEGDDLETTHHFGAFQEEKLIGVVSVFQIKNNLFFDKNQLQVRGMAILDGFQRKGIGELLLAEVEKFTSNNNISLLWFNARENAIGFYEKKKYKKIGTKFDVAGIGFHYLMYKKV